MTLAVLRAEQRAEYQIVEESRPLLDAVRTMEESQLTMVSAARGHVLTNQSAFAQQYDDAVREFDSATQQASDLAKDPRHRRIVDAMRRHQVALKKLTAEQMENGQTKDWRDLAIEISRLRRVEPDHAAQLHDQIRADQRELLENLSINRQWVMMGMIFLGVVVIVIGAISATRIEQRLRESITRQVRRTETMIGGMADGVMLVDEEGTTVFINPAGQRLLGTAAGGIP
ncbi:MAG TPA: CHASE3 domain-containing protein, partial [Thermoanaerobaculia bacterium]|nr:CHASE3 domain-containing protein [Thermoanaerobaculia bacterium]